MTARAFSTRALLASLLLAVGTWAVYAEVSEHPFVAWDDDEYVYANPHVADGLTWTGVRWALTTGWASNWHPLTWLSHMLDVEWYGTTEAGGHHATSLWLHVLNALLAFAALRELTGAFWRSWCVAALFAVHPLHVESVAWVSERKDVLSQLFWLASLWSYARFARRGERRWYTVCLALLALGLTAKSMLVTAPFLFLLLDFWPLDRLRGAWRARLAEKAPMFGLVAIVSCVTWLVQRAGGSTGWEPGSERLFVMTGGYARYLGKIFWPTDLAVFYPKVAGLYALPELLAAITLLSGVTLAAWRLRARRGYLWVGWLWFVGTLFPVSGIVPVGAHAMADRYTYMPLVGIAVAVVWGAHDLLHAPVLRDRLGLQRAAAAAITAVALVGCGLAARAQVRTWQDSETLFRHALEVTRSNDTVDHNLGVVLQRAGRFAEARRHYEAVLARDPLAAETLYNLGTLHRALGERDAAQRAFERAIAADPTRAAPHHGLGSLLEEDGAIDGAVSHYEAALRIDPQRASSHIRLGLLRLRLGHADAALTHLRRAAGLRPDLPAFQLDLGQALLATGQPAEAAELLRAVTARWPELAAGHDALGRALAAQDDLPGAIAAFREALRLDPALETARHNLAVAEAARADAP